ncbi:hypothetical protein AAIR98_001555 [Elusimicrobium simillimum]|uniref:hypothetical protein n=1 Tax=Elusimicrobium simillimum TaxID=3143438 RepID=UPI003C6F74C3
MKKLLLTILCALTAVSIFSQTLEQRYQAKKKKRSFSVSVEASQTFNIPNVAEERYYAEGAETDMFWALQELRAGGTLANAPYMDRMGFVTRMTETVTGESEDGSMTWSFRTNKYSKEAWKKVAAEFKNVKGPQYYNSMSSLSSQDLDLILQIANRLEVVLDYDKVKNAALTADLFSVKNGDRAGLRQAVKNISDYHKDDYKFLSFFSALEDSMYDIVYRDGPQKGKDSYDVFGVIDKVQLIGEGSHYVCRHITRFTQELIMESGRFKNIYIHGRSNHTETLVKMNDGNINNLSTATLRTPYLNMAATYDARGQQHITNYIYDNKGKPLMYFESEFGQLVRRAFNHDEYDPLSCGQVPNNMVVRVNNAALLVGKTNGSELDTYIFVLDAKKAGKNYSYTAGGFAAYTKNAQAQTGRSAGVKLSGSYKTPDIKFNDKFKAGVEARGEGMFQAGKILDGEQDLTDANMMVEIKPVAEIANVCGGKLGLEIAGQFYPGVKDVAIQDNVNTVALNSAWAGANYETEKNNTKLFSKLIVGTVARSAFVHGSAGAQKKLDNDDELLVMIGYVSPVGKYDPILDPVGKVYGKASYNSKKIEVDLGLYRNLVFYDTINKPNKLPQITISSRFNF